MIRVKITENRIEVRGHAPIKWCAAVSTILQMLRGMNRAIKWHESPTERSNHYIIRRVHDELDEASVEMLVALATAALPHMAIAVQSEKQRRAKHRRRPR